MALKWLLMKELGFRGISARFGLPPSRLAFTRHGFSWLESHHKPQKVIKKPFSGFLMYSACGSLGRCFTKMQLPCTCTTRFPESALNGGWMAHVKQVSYIEPVSAGVPITSG